MAVALSGFMSAVAADTLTVALTGDIMMGTTYPTTQLPPSEGRLLFQDVRNVLRTADVAAGNLEGALCDGGTSTKRLSANTFAFRTPVSYAPLLTDAGFDFLSMANNHARDFGDEGIASTEQALRKEGIAFAGIKGRTESMVIERAGLRIGFCAFGHNPYTFRHQELETVRRIITDLCSRADVVIVSFHGGAEGRSNNRLPYGTETFYGEDRGSLREFAHFCIDAGADIVYGHGPHVVRAVELYKEHLIAYSLGNFCTPYGMSLTGISGYAPVLEVKVLSDGRFAGGRIHSFIQQRGVGPRIDTQNSVAREMRRLTQLDIPNTPIHIAEDGTITRK